MSNDPKERCNRLLGEALMPFAEQMLNKRREFLPFAAALNLAGEVVLISGASESEQPAATELLELTREGLRKGAAAGQYTTTGIAVNMTVTRPEDNQKRDAVAVFLDDSGDYSVEVYFPYEFKGLLKKKVIFAAPFAQMGHKLIFE